MSRPISKAEALALVEEAFADVEQAIHSHPPEIAQTYEDAAALHRVGMDGATETEWSRSAGLSLADLRAIHRYLFAVAFMSAWWHLRRDKTRRDTAAKTACLLVSGVGIPPDEAMHHLVRYEQAWRKEMKSRPPAGVPRSGCLGAAAFLVAALGRLVGLAG